MPKALMVVFTNPASPQVEAEYNRWYNEKHLPDVTSVPGIVAATRYKLDKSVGVGPTGSATQNYLALYELEAKNSEDLARISAALNKALEAGKVDVSPALDTVGGMANFALPITDRVETPRK